MDENEIVKAVLDEILKTNRSAKYVAAAAGYITEAAVRLRRATKKDQVIDFVRDVGDVLDGLEGELLDEVFLVALRAVLAKPSDEEDLPKAA